MTRRMLSKLAAAALWSGVVMAGTAAAQAGRSNVPMTRPDLMMAVHQQSYGHTVAFVEMEGGRILMTGSGEFRTSDDGGLTWSAPFRATDAAGAPAEGQALVKLSGKAIGLGTFRRTPGGFTNRDWQALFRRSEDGGRTWSAPVVINEKGPSTAYFLQDVFLRTSSGRIVLPLYTCMGQPGRILPSKHEDAPIVGGFINGTFITTDAHYYDPAFCGSYVYYSDDDGKAWKRNRDGELFIITEPGGEMSRTTEPSVTEVSPGKLYMIMRSRLGRYYQAWSEDNGETWSRPMPTHLAGTESPAQVRTLPNGHLLCVFNQHNDEEIRRAFQETRLSTAISRNGGRLWEHFQNLESIHEEAHVEPGPIRSFKPEGKFSLRQAGAYENEGRYVQPLPVGWGYWAYPSVLVLKDRVLISHTYSRYDENAVRQTPNGNKLKVLPLRWFYGGREPFENPDVRKLKLP